MVFIVRGMKSATVVCTVCLYSWRRRKGGVGEEGEREGGGGGEREMGKERTRLNEVSVFMDACIRGWVKGGRGSWQLNLTYLACVLDFRTCTYVSF